MDPGKHGSMLCLLGKRLTKCNIAESVSIFRTLETSQKKNQILKDGPMAASVVPTYKGNEIQTEFRTPHENPSVLHFLCNGYDTGGTRGKM